MKVKGWVDRQIPESYKQGDPDRLRRARVIVLFCAVFLWYLPVPIVQNASLGNWGLVAFYASLWLILHVIPKLLRHSIELAGNVFVALDVSAISFLAYSYGGQASSQVLQLCVAPMMALMMAGRSSAKVWLAITVALGVAVTVLSAQGYVWPRPEGLQFQRFWMMGYFSGAVLVFAFAWLYETAKEQMRIGLASANAEMRLVLDNVGQGFLNVDIQGRLAATRSAITTRWFGEPLSGDTLWSWLSRHDAHFAAMLDVSWQQLVDGFLPVELSIEMLPKRLTLDDRSFGFEYQPVLGADGQPVKLVVVISDITAKLHAERAEANQRELTQVFERIQRDRAGFLQFWDDAVALVRELRAGVEHELRTLHTLKGNSLIFGVRSVADRCHALESELQESGERASPSQIEEVCGAWDAFTERVRSLIETDTRYLAVSKEDYSDLTEAVRRRTAHQELSMMLDTWRNERTATNFARMADQAQRLGERIGKQLTVEIEHNDVRLDPQRFAPLWSALVHAVRNAIDHGLETPSEREAAGKVALATLRLTSRIVDDHTILEISDDGRGINWDKLRDKAKAQGLAHASQADLEAALFSDGVSTRDEVSEVSGRGVGMGAVKQICEQLGGAISIASERGRGTRFTFQIPTKALPSKTAAA